MSVDETTAAFLARFSNKATRPRAGARTPVAGSSSAYIEALIRDADREWRHALAFLEARRFVAIADQAARLRDLEAPIPAQMVARLVPGRLADAVEADPQVAAALFVVAREMGRLNPVVASVLAEEVE